ncbi:MAG: hypothetical protein HY042_00855, partial [Spirochaetia bacterium]|nr:hypothetical protein [Spirochaetia bacterium]
MRISLLEELRWTIRRRIIGIDAAYKELYDACMRLLGRSDLGLRSVFFGSMPEDEEGRLWDPKTKRFRTYVHLAVAVRSLLVERFALSVSGIKLLSGYRGDFPGSVARLMFRRWRAGKFEPLHIHQIPLMNRLIVGSMGLRHGRTTLLRRAVLWLHRKNPDAVANLMRTMNRARLFHVRFVFETNPLTNAVETRRAPVGLIMFVSKNPDLAPEVFDPPAAKLAEIFLRNHHRLPHTIAELSESEARYKSLADMMPMAHCVYRGGRFLYMNPRGLEILGAKNLEDLNKRPVMSYVYRESRSAFLQREKSLENSDLG